MTDSPEYSDAFLDFFSFRHTNPDNSAQSFGYNPNVASYKFLEERAIVREQNLLKLQEGGDYQYLPRIKFDESERVMQKLKATAVALYDLKPNNKIKIEKVERHEACTTHPFKITCNVNNEEKVFYLKKPDTRRAVGKAFYNILVEGKFVNYKFNENGFASDTVPGKEIEDDEREQLISTRKFVEELVRLNVFTNTFFLDDILKQTNANCSYSEKHGIYLFDFDAFFKEGSYQVLSRFKKIRDIVNVKAIENDEKFKIHKNLRGNRTLIENLLTSVSEDIVDEKNFAWSRGFEDSGMLLRNELKKIGTWSEKNGY